MTSLRGYRLNLNAPEVADIKAAHARGVPVATIAKTLGVSTSTVYSHVSGGRRVPCPKCEAPMAVTSNVCRRCSDGKGGAAAARAGWSRQAPKPAAGKMDGASPSDAPTAVPGLTKRVSWQCAASPTGAHHWALNQECLGRCDCCGEVRQFSRHGTNPDF